VKITVPSFRACVLSASSVPSRQLGVNGCTYEVVRDVPGKPAMIKLLGMSGTTAKLSLPALPRKFARARIGGIAADDLLADDRVAIELGRGLLGLVGRNGPLLERVSALRTAFVADLGVVLPQVALRDDLALPDRGYRITIAGDVIGEAEIPEAACDCVILAGQADLDRSRDPAADVGLQCKIPVNADVARVVRAYAQEAGITCTVDQGASIGKSTAGNYIYEAGCAGADGFWLEKMPTGWQTTTCMQVITQSAGCKFTQPAEQAATMKAMLAGNKR
jgi:hypothetical protein